jgi:hypothetical protein
MGTGSIPGLKRPVRGVDHPPLSSADVKERIELNIYSTSGPSLTTKKLEKIHKGVKKSKNEET